jgi:hypothetical protein
VVRSRYSARFSARLWLARRRTRFLVTRVAALSSLVVFDVDSSAELARCRASPCLV